MADVPGSALAGSEQVWRSQVGMARDVVRQELVSRQLQAHLPPVGAGDKSVRVLDVGCGQGTQAILLARAGYHVVGWDPPRRSSTTPGWRWPRSRLRYRPACCFEEAGRRDPYRHLAALTHTIGIRTE